VGLLKTGALESLKYSTFDMQFCVELRTICKENVSIIYDLVVVEYKLLELSWLFKFKISIMNSSYFRTNLLLLSLILQWYLLTLRAFQKRKICDSSNENKKCALLLELRDTSYVNPQTCALTATIILSKSSMPNSLPPHFPSWMISDNYDHS